MDTITIKESINLKIKLHKIKHIKDAEFSMRLDKGLYAITGENAGSAVGDSVLSVAKYFVYLQTELNRSRNSYVRLRKDKRQ